MLRTLVSIVLIAALSGVACTQQKPEAPVPAEPAPVVSTEAPALVPEAQDPAHIADNDYGGYITVIAKGDGKAELRIWDLRQVEARPADSLYCLAKVGKGWPGNKENDRFDVPKMPCGKAEGGWVTIQYQWPDYTKGATGIAGYTPITVKAPGQDGKGELFAWEKKPIVHEGALARGRGFQSSVTGKYESIIPLYLAPDGTIFAGTPEQAAQLKD